MDKVLNMKLNPLTNLEGQGLSINLNIIRNLEWTRLNIGI